MPLKLYNTLTRKKEIFKPIKGRNVKFFVCGPTVYDYGHIGHAKTYAQFDIIVKYFRYRKYDVFYLQNITDIDDKIIKKAKDENKTPKEIAEFFLEKYLEDIQALGINSISKYAKATDYIDQIVSQVKRLLKKGYAYKISDGIYFDLSKDDDYGKLAQRTSLDAEDAVSRIDEHAEKKNKGDFCLWKFYRVNDPYWETIVEFDVTSEEYKNLVEQAIKDKDTEFLELNNIKVNKMLKDKSEIICQKLN